MGDSSDRIGFTTRKMSHPLPSSGLAPDSGELRNTLQQEAIDVVLKELNDFFSTYTAVSDFKSAVNPGDPVTEPYQQKLFISYKSPEDDRFLPALIVRISDLQEFRTDLGNAWEKLPDGGLRSGGTVKATINVTVASLSSLDLDRLTDFVQLFFLIIKVPDLQKQGLLLVPNSVRASDPGPVAYTGDRPILRSLVSVQVWLQWFLDVPETNPTVTNVAIRLVRPNGSFEEEVI